MAQAYEPEVLASKTFWITLAGCIAFALGAYVSVGF